MPPRRPPTPQKPAPSLAPVIDLPPHVDASPQFKNFLLSIITGLAFSYSELITAWNSCGTSNPCRIQKLSAYLLMVYGSSRPAVHMSRLLQNLVNNAWFQVGGTKLLSEDSGWVSSIMTAGFSIGVEKGMSFVWDWVESASACLKKGNLEDCEYDDILIWISNMKTRYCDGAQDEAVVTLNCDKDDETCMEVDVTDNEDLDWCLIFYNELPVIILGVVVGTIYVLSNQLADLAEIVVANVDMQKLSSNDTIDNLPGDNDPNPVAPAKDKRKRSKRSTTDKPVSDPKNKKRNNPKTPPYQKLEIYCPLCNEHYIGCFPDPMEICCGECGGGNSSNSTNPTDQPPMTMHPSIDLRVSSNLNGQNNNFTYPSSSEDTGVHFWFAPCHPSPSVKLDNDANLFGKIVVEQLYSGRADDIQQCCNHMRTIIIENSTESDDEQRGSSHSSDTGESNQEKILNNESDYSDDWEEYHPQKDEEGEGNQRICDYCMMIQHKRENRITPTSHDKPEWSTDIESSSELE